MHKFRSLRSVAGLSTAIGLVLAAPAMAQTLPSGGSFSSGTGIIVPGGNTLTVMQLSNRGVVNWNSFSIGSGNTVNINNGSGATLNRVTGGSLSTIAGALNGTGSVFLINPNGVVVAAGGKVVTGGNFVASTRDTSNTAFMNGGPLTFAGTSAGTVTNLGQITSTNGDVVLVGASVSNSGGISAANGTAGLVAANNVVLTDGTGPAGLSVVPDATSTGATTNSGTVKAAAVALAAAGGNVYALAGNTGSLIQATGTSSINGQVWLSAPNGTTSITGSVAAANANGAGGTIKATGSTLSIAATASLNAAPTKSGAAGGSIETSGGTITLANATVTAGSGGSWVIDPSNLTINAAGGATVGTTLSAGTNVTEETTATGTSGTGTTSSGAGDINVTGGISWTGPAALTLSAFNNVNLSAPISVGNGGGLTVTTGNNLGGTSAAGTGFNILSGGGVSYAGTSGALSINGTPYTLLFTEPQVEAIGLTGNYALANNVSFTSASVTPIGANGQNPNKFQGTLNGLGNTISGLTIVDPADPSVGLIAALGAGASVSNIGFTNASITTGLSGEAGALAGYNLGNVSNVSVTNSVIGWGNTAGAIIGYNPGTLNGGSASGDTLIAYAQDGGLVGENSGTIENSAISNSTVTSFDTALTDPISDNYNALVPPAVDGVTLISYAGGVTGYNAPGTASNQPGLVSNVTANNVSVSNATQAGGIAGYSSGTVTQSKAIGNATIADNAAGTILAFAGGAVGDNLGTISYTSASVAVQGLLFGGGLVGFNNGGNISQADATGTVNALVASGGLVGGNTGNLTNVYATGAVTGTGDSGGLIGSEYGGVVSNAYAANSVQGNQAAGAVVGLYNAGSFSNVYYYTGGTQSGYNGAAVLYSAGQNSGVAASTANNAYGFVYNPSAVPGAAATGGAGITPGTTPGFSSAYWSGGSGNSFPTLLNMP